MGYSQNSSSNAGWENRGAKAEAQFPLLPIAGARRVIYALSGSAAQLEHSEGHSRQGALFSTNSKVYFPSHAHS